RRQQEVDGGTGGIDGPIEVTPTAFHSNIRLIDPPGFVGRLEMTAQPLFQLGTVTLNPAPDRRVIGLQTAFGEQLFDVAERERVAKIPAHGTQNQLRCRLPPLEDCRSGYVLHGLFRLPASPAKVATHPEKLIDVVVVYKVDRLTRSLADFAKMVEIFDSDGVSFVAVTQQFNTTTSMGRLTLNVLLSFAQFEREVTGERIRDKIAASKKKGLWMGGTIPLGYDWRDRRLVVNEAEAATVRQIFERYLDLRSVLCVANC